MNLFAATPVLFTLTLTAFTTAPVLYASPQGAKYEIAKWKGKLNKKKRRMGQWIYGTKKVHLIIANYKAGELHGNYQSFYADGKKRQHSSYVTNLLSGKFEIFYNNKNNSSAVRGYYHKGHKYRQWSRWTPQERLISQANYDHGLKSGYYTSFVNGKIYQLYQYRKGLLNGLAKIYNPAQNRVVAQGNYVNNLRQGKWKYWDSNGSKLIKVANFLNGKLQEKTIQYNEHGRLWKNWTYKKGKLHGPYVEYFDIDSRTVLHSGKYVNNQRSGIWTSYYKSSKIWKRTPYKNGKLNGGYIQYYRNGRVWKTSNYVHNKLQGKYSLYSNRSINAQLLTGQYHNNYRTGKWLYWYPDGKTINKVVFYKDGTLNGITTRYYPSGRQWVKSQYKQNELDGFYIVYYDNARNSKKLRGAHKNNMPDGKWTYWNTQGKVVIPHKQTHAKKN